MNRGNEFFLLPGGSMCVFLFIRTVPYLVGGPQRQGRVVRFVHMADTVTR